MKRSMLIGGVSILVVWLGLWFTSTGVLVYSSSIGALGTRDCRYLAGVTVQKHFERRTARCPFIRKVR